EEAVSPQFAAQARVGVRRRPDHPAAPAGVDRVHRLVAVEEAAGGRADAVGGDDEVDLELGGPRAGEANAEGSRAVPTLDRAHGGAVGDLARGGGPGEAVEQGAAVD